MHARTDALREELERAFEDRELTRGSLLLSRKRRLHQQLDDLDDAAAGQRWAKARELVDDVATLAPQVLEAARDLPPRAARPDVPRGPTVLRNVGTVARKEAVLLARGTQGLLLFGLLVLTFGIGLRSAIGGSTVTGTSASVELVWTYAHSLDFLAIPLAGILAGYGLVNEELRSNTIHVLAAQPVSRVGIVLGKWLGMALALGAAVVASAGLVGAIAYASTGTLGDPGTVIAYPIACFALALAFGSLALLASTLIDRTGPTLTAGIGAFIVLGPVWQNAFLTRSLEAGGANPPMTDVLVYLATPFTAWWNWTSELLGPVNEATGLPEGEPWHAALVNAVATGSLEGLPFYATQPFYVLVIVAWMVVSVAAAVAVLRRRDLG